MAQLLELLEFLEDNRMPEVQVGRCRIEPELDPERPFV